MSDLEQNSGFEEAWKKALDDASLPTPDHLWEQIEASLPSSTEPKPLAWWYRYRGVVSAAALCLLMLSFWWFWPKATDQNMALENQGVHSTNKNTITDREDSEGANKLTQSNKQSGSESSLGKEQTENSTVLPSSKAPSGVLEKNVSITDKNMENIVSADTKRESISTRKSLESVSNKQSVILEKDKLKIADIEQEKIDYIAKNKSEKEISTSVDKSVEKSPRKNDVPRLTVDNYTINTRANVNNTDNSTSNSIPSNINVPSLGGSTEPLKAQVNAIQLSWLKSKDFSVQSLNRPVLKYRFKSTFLPPPKPVKTDKWIGFTAMGGFFNPTVSTNAPAAVAAAITPQNGSRGLNFTGANADASNNLGYASNTSAVPSVKVELLIGQKLSKNWFVETGIGYYRGNSILDDNTYLIDRVNNTRSSAYSRLVSTSKNQLSVAELNNNNIVVNTALPIRVRNDFQFLNIPFRVGYWFNPNKKLSFSLAAGASADLFLKNTMSTLDNTDFSLVEITRDDEVYKTVNLNAVITPSIHYRIAQRWDVSIEGTIQKALSEGIQGENAAIQIKPVYIGVGVGVRRHF
jgi:hypothetical protein